MRNVLKRTDKYFWFATAIIAAGCAVRLFALGSIPCGLIRTKPLPGIMRGPCCITVWILLATITLFISRPGALA